MGQVGEGDFFWELNGRRQFPKVAEDVDVQLQKYKAAIEDINRKTGSNMDPNADPNDMMQVCSLPLESSSGHDLWFQVYHLGIVVHYGHLLMPKYMALC